MEIKKVIVKKDILNKLSSLHGTEEDIKIFVDIVKNEYRGIVIKLLPNNFADVSFCGGKYNWILTINMLTRVSEVNNIRESKHCLMCKHCIIDDDIPFCQVWNCMAYDNMVCDRYNKKCDEWYYGNI